MNPNRYQRYRRSPQEQQEPRKYVARENEYRSECGRYFWNKDAMDEHENYCAWCRKKGKKK